MKMTARRLSMLSAPKHRKMYKGVMSFATAELAKVRSQNLLEKAAPVPVAMANTSESKNKYGGALNDSSGGVTSSSSGGGSHGSGVGGNNTKSETPVSTIVDTITTKPAVRSKPVIPQQRPLSMPSSSAKKLWKMPEHFAKLLKTEETSEVVDPAVASTKPSFADNMKKNVASQSRLYGSSGGDSGGHKNVKHFMGLLSATKTGTKTNAAPPPNDSSTATTGTRDSTVEVSSSNPAIVPVTNIVIDVCTDSATHCMTSGRYLTARNARESRNVAVAAAAASYAKSNPALAESNGGGSAGVSTSTTTSQSIPVRSLNQSKSDPIFTFNDAKKPSTAPTMSQQSPAEADNAFSRFNSTAKKRTFGNATMASKLRTEPVGVNKITTRSNFSAARATPRPSTVPGGAGTDQSGPHSSVLKSSSSGPVSAANLKSNEGNALPNSRGGTASGAMSSLGGVSVSVKVKKVAESDNICSAVSKSPAGIGGKVNVRDLMRGGAQVISASRQDSTRGGDSDGNDLSSFEGKNKGVTSSASPRYIPAGVAGRAELSKNSPRVDSELMSSDKQKREIVSDSAVIVKQSISSKESGFDESDDRCAEAGPETGRSATLFQSLSSYHTPTAASISTSATSATAATDSATAQSATFSHLRRGSLERKPPLGAPFSGGLTPGHAASATANTPHPLTTLASTPPAQLIVIVDDTEEEVADEAASAAAIELRNARRRFRLSRDAAAAAVENNKSSRRREFNFVASSNVKNSPEVKNEVQPPSPGQRGVEGSGSGGRRNFGSPARVLSKGDISLSCAIKSCIRTPSIDGMLVRSTSGGKPAAAKKKRVRFADEVPQRGEDSNTFKVNYVGSFMKPVVVIRAKPRFDTPPPRNVEEALLFSKLKADNSMEHQSEVINNHHGSGNDNNCINNRSGGIANTVLNLPPRHVATPPETSARSDVTVSLSRDECEEYFMTFDKESFVF